MTAEFIHGYQVTHRRLSSAAKMELAELGEKLGKTLAVHGAVFGGADVVIVRPRDRADALEKVRLPPGYPALADAISVRCPSDAAEIATEITSAAPEVTS